MDNMNATPRLHPLVATATVALILVSLAGLAAITGMITDPEAQEKNMERSGITKANMVADVTTRAEKAERKTQPEQ